MVNLRINCDHKFDVFSFVLSHDKIIRVSLNTWSFRRQGIYENLVAFFNIHLTCKLIKCAKSENKSAFTQDLFMFCRKKSFMPIEPRAETLKLLKLLKSSSYVVGEWWISCWSKQLTWETKLISDFPKRAKNFSRSCKHFHQQKWSKDIDKLNQVLHFMRQCCWMLLKGNYTRLLAALLINEENKIFIEGKWKTLMS